MAFIRVKDNLPSISHDQPIELLNKAYRLCASAKDKASSIDFPQLVSDAKDWGVEHPYQTGFYVASGVLMAAPGLATVPVLGLAGFTAEGVAGGSAAAAAQSAAGQVAARSFFATLQSAGAAGYGLPIVNGAVQGSIAGAQALHVGIRALWKKSPSLRDAEVTEAVDAAEDSDNDGNAERGNIVEDDKGGEIPEDQEGTADGTEGMKAKL